MSLSKGIPRDTLKAILGCDLAMGGFSGSSATGQPGDPLPACKPVTTFPSSLSLSVAVD